ncbi:hypothetical protein LPJ66_005849 [Kickxella alabastrina]|uniref:Uncharacterized protein n=1 Tax=Kickxella alabastrina TaxID=61397 RepID=A0ACC1IFQ8_9FUNG|nr:hypothetical protein LPJ66_005849 [Kickxella alabastrina]
MATPRTHAIFEEMDFPDAFSNNTAQHQPPPEKRQRTNSMSERFFEIPTGSTSSSPAESTGHRTPRKTSAATNKALRTAAAAGGKSAEIKRKVPAAAVSNGSGSQMMSSNGSMVGRLTSNSKSLERMGQESEYAGLSIENLMRMFTPSQQGQQQHQQQNQQQGQGDISVDCLPLSSNNATKLSDFLPLVSGIPTHTDVAGSMAVDDSAAAHSQANGFPVHGSESNDQLAHLLSADDFNNLTMLSNSGVAAAGEAAVPLVGSGANLAANMFDGAGLASLFEYMANQPAAAAAAATNMHVGNGGTSGGDAYESSFMGSGSGSGQAYGTQWLVDALKSLTPEQQQSMYNYYRNAGHVNHVPLLTAESQDSMDIGSGADGSSFLEFVDPNAENIDGGGGGSSSSSSSVGAVGDLGIVDISSSVSTSGVGSVEDDYGILFKEALGSDIVGLPDVAAADSASTDGAGLVVDVSGIHPDLAATLFHTSPVAAPTSDVLDMLNSPGSSLVATSSVQSEPNDM